MVCPDRFFEDTEGGVCEPCHSDCELCDGPEPNKCDSCTDPDSVLHNGACLPPCPSHTYRESRSGECMGEILYVIFTFYHQYWIYTNCIVAVLFFRSALAFSVLINGTCHAKIT